MLIETRSRFIEKVASGDLSIVELTRDGPRFEYTKKGLKKLRPDYGHRGKPVVRILAIACVLILVWVLASIGI